MMSSNKGPRCTKINFESSTDIDIPQLSDMLDGMALNSCPRPQTPIQLSPQTSNKLSPQQVQDINRRFSSVLINKDEDFITKQNEPFDCEDVSRYRVHHATAAAGKRISGTLLTTRTNKNPNSPTTGNHTKRMRRSFYKWSVNKSPRDLVAIPVVPQLPCYSFGKKRIPILPSLTHNRIDDKKI